MKKIEVAAFLLVVLWVIAVLPPWGFRLFAGRFFGPTEFGALTAGHKAMATADGILAAAVQIGVGAWLFSLARRTKHNPFVWALFGLTYGLLAVILFFVMRIHNSMGISVNDGPCDNTLDRYRLKPRQARLQTNRQRERWHHIRKSNG